MSPCGLPIFSQLAVPEDLAADGAGGVLDDGQAVAPADLDRRAQVAGHAQLVDAQDRLASRGVIARSIKVGIDVVAVRLDVDEDRRRRRNSGWRWPWR